jgi:hypothetical protein
MVLFPRKTKGILSFPNGFFKTTLFSISMQALVAGGTGLIGSHLIAGQWAQ